MRIPVVLCSILLVLAPVASRAGATQTEPHAMLYFEVPFDAGSHDSGSGFGLRLDRVDVERSHGIHVMSPLMIHQVPLFDFKAGVSGVERLSIAGTDYLRLLYINREDSKDKGAAGAQPEEDKVTLKKILHDTPVGYLMGAVIGVVIVTGISH